LLAEGNSMEWQKGANHVLALPTEEHHVADRVYEATDLWSGEPTASSSAWQELLVRRIEEADELRKLAESDSAKNRAMAEAALTELITVRPRRPCFPWRLWVEVAAPATHTRPFVRSFTGPAPQLLRHSCFMPWGEKSSPGGQACHAGPNAASATTTLWRMTNGDTGGDVCRHPSIQPAPSGRQRALACGTDAAWALPQAREEAAQAWGLLKENGVLPPAREELPRYNGNGNGNFPRRLR
jgi:hypothetical protein